MSCETITRKLILLLYGELDDAERATIDSHLDSCANCRVALAEERRMRTVLSVRESPEPGDDLLAACRGELSSAVRRAGRSAGPGFERSRIRRSGGWHVWSLLAKPSPALAAALLVAGFLSGWWVMGGGVGSHDRPSLASATDRTTTDLHSVQVEPGGERVNLTYDTRTRNSVQGRVEDPAIRRLLADTVRESSNAGMRLDAIGLLEGQVADADVRRALLHALRDDRNAGARLKALAALDPQASANSEVREAMTDALLRDDNLGVRVRAIDALARTGDPQLAPLMRRLAREDSEPYIRLRSGAIADEMYARVNPEVKR